MRRRIASASSAFPDRNDVGLTAQPRRLLGHYLLPLPSGKCSADFGFALSDLLLAALWWHDRALAATRRVYAVMWAWYVASAVLRYSLAQTSVWRALVRA